MSGFTVWWEVQQLEEKAHFSYISTGTGLEWNADGFKYAQRVATNLWTLIRNMSGLQHWLLWRNGKTIPCKKLWRTKWSYWLKSSFLLSCNIHKCEWDLRGITTALVCSSCKVLSMMEFDSLVSIHFHWQYAEFRQHFRANCHFKTRSGGKIACLHFSFPPALCKCLSPHCLSIFCLVLSWELSLIRGWALLHTLGIGKTTAHWYHQQNTKHGWRIWHNLADIICPVPL